MVKVKRETGVLPLNVTCLLIRGLQSSADYQGCYAARWVKELNSSGYKCPSVPYIVNVGIIFLLPASFPGSEFGCVRGLELIVGLNVPSYVLVYLS